MGSVAEEDPGQRIEQIDARGRTRRRPLRRLLALAFPLLASGVITGDDRILTRNHARSATPCKLARLD
jgi:hypothetical protein